MFEYVKVDSNLADSINQELHSTKVPWEFAPRTTNFYETAATAAERLVVESIESKHGPFVDTQKFSWTIYNGSFMKDPFIKIRQDPNTRYNKHFPSIAKLVNHLQSNYIPQDYKVARIICNMQTIRPLWVKNAIHPDSRHPGAISILYYANDSDGETFFFEGDECAHRVTPTKGTAVLYPSAMFHAGSTPTKTETRVVINMMFGR